jgi:spore germination protein YaaH
MLPWNRRPLVTSVALTLSGLLLLALAAGQPAQAGNRVAPKPYVTGWLPYWDSAAATRSVVNNAAVFQDASPFAFDADGVRQITLTESEDEWRSMRRSLRSADVRIIPTVATDLSADEFARIVGDPERRTAHVKALASVVERYRLDGIDLDYESINVGTSTAKNVVRRGYPKLLAQLNSRLDREGAVASVTVAARRSNSDPNWWVFDYPALGRAADRVRIMTYDYHWSGGPAGPIAPKYWVNEVAKYAARVIPPRKVSLGMPAYGRDWFAGKVSGTCPASAKATISRTTRSMQEFARNLDVQPWWVKAESSRTFSYVKKYSSGGQTCKAKRVVWYDDARSLETKTPLVERYGLRGIAIWALGNEGVGTWPNLTDFGRQLARR